MSTDLYDAETVRLLQGFQAIGHSLEDTNRWIDAALTCASSGATPETLRTIAQWLASGVIQIDECGASPTMVVRAQH